MIRLNVVGHDDICGGYSYSGPVSFDGKTVKEVLDEIREFAKDKDAQYLGDGFGNSSSDSCDAWCIKIDEITYWNSWVEQSWNKYGTYDSSLDNLLVDKVVVHGGWYCFYDFEIFTKK